MPSLSLRGGYTELEWVWPKPGSKLHAGLSQPQEQPKEKGDMETVSKTTSLSSVARLAGDWRGSAVPEQTSSRATVETTWPGIRQ